MYRLIPTAPVFPTFPKPSWYQLLNPKLNGPVPGSPSPATSQHVFGGNPPEKSSS